MDAEETRQYYMGKVQAQMQEKEEMWAAARTEISRLTDRCNELSMLNTLSFASVATEVRQWALSHAKTVILTQGGGGGRTQQQQQPQHQRPERQHVLDATAVANSTPATTPTNSSISNTAKDEGSDSPSSAAASALTAPSSPSTGATTAPAQATTTTRKASVAVVPLSDLLQYLHTMSNGLVPQVANEKKKYRRVSANTTPRHRPMNRQHQQQQQQQQHTATAASSASSTTLTTSFSGLKSANTVTAPARTEGNNSPASLGEDSDREESCLARKVMRVEELEKETTDKNRPQCSSTCEAVQMGQQRAALRKAAARDARRKGGSSSALSAAYALSRRQQQQAAVATETTANTTSTTSVAVNGPNPFLSSVRSLIAEKEEEGEEEGEPIPEMREEEPGIDEHQHQQLAPALPQQQHQQQSPQPVQVVDHCHQPVVAPADAVEYQHPHGIIEEQEEQVMVNPQQEQQQPVELEEGQEVIAEEEQQGHHQHQVQEEHQHQQQHQLVESAEDVGLPPTTIVVSDGIIMPEAAAVEATSAATPAAPVINAAESNNMSTATATETGTSNNNKNNFRPTPRMNPRLRRWEILNNINTPSTSTFSLNPPPPSSSSSSSSTTTDTTTNGNSDNSVWSVKRTRSRLGRGHQQPAGSQQQQHPGGIQRRGVPLAINNINSCRYTSAFATHRRHNQGGDERLAAAGETDQIDEDDHDVQHVEASGVQPRTDGGDDDMEEEENDDDVNEIEGEEEANDDAAEADHRVEPLRRKIIDSSSLPPPHSVRVIEKED